jgi:hypothetical protein
MNGQGGGGVLIVFPRGARHTPLRKEEWTLD